MRIESVWTGFLGGKSIQHAFFLCVGVVFSAFAFVVVFMSEAVAEPSSVDSLEPQNEASPDLEAEAPLDLEADEVIYDFDNDIVTAKGHVTLRSRGQFLRADRIEYNRKTGDVAANGNIATLDAQGNIVYSQRVLLNEQLTKGFIEVLDVETVERTRFRAENAEQLEKDVYLFRNGHYQTCTDCGKDQKATWRVKAERIVYNRKEKIVHYKDARFELLGVPIAYLPYFGHATRDKKRKSGFLLPRYRHSDETGFGGTVPFYWAIAPDMDLLLSPTYFVRQGLLGDATFRHRLKAGTYSFRATGIYQRAPEAFQSTTAQRDFRGFVESSGDFALSSKWNTGWRLAHATDIDFDNDYAQQYTLAPGGVSQLYLTGLGKRSYLDLRGYDFRVTHSNNKEGSEPLVGPVLNYHSVWDRNIVGGELSLNVNAVRFSRHDEDAFVISGERFIRGAEGEAARGSVDLRFRRRFMAPFGQVLIPFGGLRADAVSQDIQSTSSLSYEEDRKFRLVPTAGLEYRWPFISTHSWGSQIFEPLAQLVVRPSDVHNSIVTNEDSQSLVFDSSNLFDWDKYSGYDRVESGTRLNTGFNYNLQTAGGFSVDALIGQSFQLVGENAFSQEDDLLTGQSSGLNRRKSDFVGHLNVDTGLGFGVSSRGRFDPKTFALKWGEIQGYAAYGPLGVSSAFTRISRRPEFEVEEDLDIARVAASLRLNDYWRVFGSADFDLTNDIRLKTGGGVSYDDEHFTASFTIRQKYAPTNKVDDTRFLFTIDLKTIGGAAYELNAN